MKIELIILIWYNQSEWSEWRLKVGFTGSIGIPFDIGFWEFTQRSLKAPFRKAQKEAWPVHLFHLFSRCLTLIDKTSRNDNLIIITILITNDYKKSNNPPVIAQQAHQFLDCPGAISRRFEGPATWSRASTVTTDGFCWGTCLRIPEVNWIPKET